ncbi:MAG: hypothetical protein CL930_05440 [Deltaproteobacteria bacterium]|nr:hypothetical protein [Deltaproteobacteria bacterium]
MWTQGEQVPVVDILNMEDSAPDVPPDTEDPDGDSGISDPPTEPTESDEDFSHSDAKLNAGGCSVSPVYPYKYVLVTIAALLGFRRKRCDTL